MKVIGTVANLSHMMEAHHSTEQNVDHILSVIGLKRNMTWRSGGGKIYEEENFEHYVSHKYKDSKWKDSDEVYGMYELTLLHNKTGLRITYITTESYDGNTVEYRLSNIFIISATEKLYVTDADFNKEIFFTKDNRIPFSEVDRMVE